VAGPEEGAWAEEVLQILGSTDSVWLVFRPRKSAHNSFEAAVRKYWSSDDADNFRAPDLGGMRIDRKSNEFADLARLGVGGGRKWI
jgi:hypothetical protein